MKGCRGQEGARSWARRPEAVALPLPGRGSPGRPASGGSPGARDLWGSRKLLNPTLVKGRCHFNICSRHFGN